MESHGLLSRASSNHDGQEPLSTARGSNLSMNNQEFVEIESLPGYRVSSQGRIWSDFTRQERKTEVRESGRVVLRIKGQTVSHRIDKIVCAAFMPGYDGTQKIWHRDGNKRNCSLDNLCIEPKPPKEKTRKELPSVESISRAGELFVTIEGYEYYLVSNQGRIVAARTMKELTTNKTNKGYIGLKLCNKDGIKWISIHRLVATHFVHNPENKPQVNHKDMVKTNNRADNLEWVTDKENKRHAIGFKKHEQC